MSEGEEESEVTADAFFFEFGSGLDAFPGGSHLDEDAFFGDAGGFVESDELFSFGDRGGFVERETSVDFGGDAAGDDFQNFGAEGDEKCVDGGLNAFATVILGSFVEQRFVFGHLHGLKDEARVRGSVERLEGLHGGEVTRVGDYFGMLAKLFECVHRVMSEW